MSLDHLTTATTWIKKTLKKDTTTWIKKTLKKRSSFEAAGSSLRLSYLAGHLSLQFEMIYVFTQPIHTNRKRHKRGLTDKQSFPSSRLVAIPKLKSPTVYDHIRRKVGYTSFPRVLAHYEMQTDSSMIWTRSDVYIFYDDNFYTTSSYKIIYIYIYIYIIQTGLFKLGMATDPEERKLWIQTHQTPEVGYIYIYIYIYCYQQTDCFVVSELFSVARHIGRLKLGLKPAQLYVRLRIRPLGQQAYHIS